MKQFILGILFIVFGSIFMYSQTKVGGQVYDGNKQPIPFANVVFVNSTVGTITDENGNFYMESDESYSSIKISFLGFETKTIPLTKKVTYKMEIILEEEAATLDAVVIYKGKTSKKNNPAIDILRKKEGNDWLVKKILDKAGNKGTGNWTTIASAELGIPSTLIASALFARYTSFYKDERIQLNTNFKSETLSALNLSSKEILEAYQFARIINHYQGFKLIAEASNTFSWNLNLSEIARIWTNGCIIRSTLMDDLVEVFKGTTNILTNVQLIASIKQYKDSVKKVVSQCVLSDVSAICMSESIQFFNGITTADSSASIIQAQRDYFGAHTYNRIDDDGVKSHHTNWK